MNCVRLQDKAALSCILLLGGTTSDVFPSSKVANRDFITDSYTLRKLDWYTLKLASDTTAKSITKDLSFRIYEPYGHMTYKKVSCSCITLHFEDDSYEFSGVMCACALNKINAKVMWLNQLKYLNSDTPGHDWQAHICPWPSCKCAGRAPQVCLAQRANGKPKEKWWWRQKCREDSGCSDWQYRSSYESTFTSFQNEQLREFRSFF